MRSYRPNNIGVPDLRGTAATGYGIVGSKNRYNYSSFNDPSQDNRGLENLAGTNRQGVSNELMSFAQDNKGLDKKSFVQELVQE